MPKRDGPLDPLAGLDFIKHNFGIWEFVYFCIFYLYVSSFVKKKKLQFSNDDNDKAIMAASAKYPSWLIVYETSWWSHFNVLTT